MPLPHLVSSVSSNVTNQMFLHYKCVACNGVGGIRPSVKMLYNGVGVFTLVLCYTCFF